MGCVGVQTTTRASTKAYAGTDERALREGAEIRTSKITEFTKNHHWDGWMD